MTDQFRNLQSQFHRLVLPETRLVLIGALFIGLVNNRTLLHYIFNLNLTGPEAFLFKISTVFLLIILLSLILFVFFLFRLTKPILVVMIILSNFADFLMLNYGVLVDSTAMQSLLETTMTESRQFFSWHMILPFICFGLAPSLFVYFVRVNRPDLSKRVRKFFGYLILHILAIGVIGAFFYKDYASFFRNNRQVRHMFSPVNVLYESFRYGQRRFFPKDTTFVKIGEDAKHISGSRKRFVVFVLGETARADHFSLNGYPRPTNPELAKENVISFKEVTSCGTATATSVPCLFSDLGRSRFNADNSENRENLLDITQRAGYRTEWIDNNTGCKDVCARVENTDMSKLVLPNLCDKNGCFDEVLLKGLANIPTDDGKDHFVVLHMLGSHGPTYYLRYPPTHARFQPSCNTSQLIECSKDQVINAYDNTILYTDHIVAETIRYLKTLTDYDTALVYISDHGESLGENGIYLHSLPYSLAPAEQKRVPMIFWFSDSLVKNSPGLLEQMNKTKDCKWSHDNVFHSMIGFLDIQTHEYKKELDFFNPQAACE